MNTEDLGNSKLLNLLFRPAGAMMGSKLRQRLADPVRTLRGAGIGAGQIVLEVERCAAGRAPVTLVPHMGGGVHDPAVILAAIEEAAR